MRSQWTVCLVLLSALFCGSKCEGQRDLPSWFEEALNIDRSNDNPLTSKDYLRLGVGKESLANLEAWCSAREELRNRWVEFLGMRKISVNHSRAVTVIREDTLQGVSRQLVEYESEVGEVVQAYLLQPTGVKEKKSLPGIVAFHPTNPLNIDEIAGIKQEGPRATGLHLARRGYVVICPKCFLWKEAVSYQEAADRFRSSHHGALGMAKMLFDAQRALDILAASPLVDEKRLGAFGHSLGAKEAFYLSAFDERVRSVVASEGGLGLDSTNWDADWYLGPVVKKPDFPLHHEELVALISPRPFLVLAGERGEGAADGERSRHLLRRAIPVWKLATVGSSAPQTYLGLWNHGRGHVFGDEELAKTLDWFSATLR